MSGEILINKMVWHPDIINVVNNSYGVNGLWTKKLIKRKYKSNPAIYLDVWQPYPKSKFIMDLLPRVKLQDTDRNKS